MPLSPLEILARCPLFAQAAEDDLQALAAIAQQRTFDAGQTLFLAGEEPEGLHVVVRGRVGIHVLSPATGREVVLTVEHPYNTVAELPSFDGGTYPANAEALADTETLFLEQKAFEEVLGRRSGLALLMLRTLGRRLRRLVGLVESLSFQEVVHRLASYLEERAVAELPFQLDTNAHIAAYLGTVPELVSRNLARLHQSGAIELDGREVVRVDRAALSELARSAGR